MPSTSLFCSVNVFNYIIINVYTKYQHRARSFRGKGRGINNNDGNISVMTKSGICAFNTEESYSGIRINALTTLFIQKY